MLFKKIIHVCNETYTKIWIKNADLLIFKSVGTYNYHLFAESSVSFIIYTYVFCYVYIIRWNIRHIQWNFCILKSVCKYSAWRTQHEWLNNELNGSIGRVRDECSIYFTCSIKRGVRKSTLQRHTEYYTVQFERRLLLYALYSAM